MRELTRQELVEVYTTLLKDHIKTLEQYSVVEVSTVERILPPEGWTKLQADKIRFNGPAPGYVYSWNVIDYVIDFGFSASWPKREFTSGQVAELVGIGRPAVRAADDVLKPRLTAGGHRRYTEEAVMRWHATWPEGLTTGDLAAIVRVHPGTIRKWGREGVIGPPIRATIHSIWPLDDVQKAWNHKYDLIRTKRRGRRFKQRGEK